MTASIMWFRRDLRLADNPALAAAVESADSVLPLFVVDPALWSPAGAPRRSYLAASLHALSDRIGGLVVRTGNPSEVVPAVAAEAAADQVFIAADFGPYGAKRDERVESALLERGGRRLVRRGSPYAVDPGEVRNQQDDGYQVFTPFSRAWRDQGWADPVPAPRGTSAGDSTWAARASRTATTPDDLAHAARRRGWPPDDAGVPSWTRSLRTTRRLETDPTSTRPRGCRCISSGVRSTRGRCSPTCASDVASRDGDTRPSWPGASSTRTYWRDDRRRPATTTGPSWRRCDTTAPGAQFEAWCDGRTGYPIVDAGMRQLRHEGWMHNRVRMIVASFLVKDLHIEWQHGARHFMRWLVDGDLASNQHGWQWTAGCGTDAAPYFRIFNPIEQGRKFDPDGVYIRRHVPELRDLTNEDLHQPHDPIVDHAAERREALARYEAVRRR